MLVDVFNTPAERDAFKRRRADVLASAELCSFKVRSDIIIGGGGLALSGIDAFVKMPGSSGFDLDVICGCGLCGSGGDKIVGRHFNPSAPLWPTVMKPDKVRAFTIYEDFEAMAEASVAIDGLSTSPVRDLVAAKLKRGSAKDVAGIIKFQVVADAAEDSILRQAHWRVAVADAVWLCTEGPVAEQLRIDLPWVRELADESFEHQAFQKYGWAGV